MSDEMSAKAKLSTPSSGRGSQIIHIVVLSLVVIAIVAVIVVVAGKMGGGVGDAVPSGTLIPLSAVAKPSASSYVWTHSTDGTSSAVSLVTSKLELVVDNNSGDPVLELSWCANGGDAQTNPASATWIIVWTSKEGLRADDSAYNNVANELSALALQGFHAPVELYFDTDSDAEEAHALYLRGRWFFVGATPVLNLAWSPLCGSDPLASAQHANPEVPSWFPRGISQGTPESLVVLPILTSADGAFRLVLETFGDLQIRSTLNGATIWSARESSIGSSKLAVATGCLPLVP